ncbi:hypothetical protein ACOKM5_42905 [Streptomyces sp. BH097]|uniref:hypothetical protein n=1 Tax=unclassified Streptomyces TaxID=2593676 RepID=UPI003BB51FA2
MSLRYETTAADHTAIDVITPDTDPDTHGLEDLPQGTHALIIGSPAAAAHAVIGTPDKLRAFAARLAAATGAHQALPQAPLHSERISSEAAELIAGYRAHIRAYRLPAEDGQDPDDTDIDPTHFPAYDEARADWGEAALRFISDLAEQAPPQRPAT